MKGDQTHNPPKSSPNSFRDVIQNLRPCLSTEKSASAHDSATALIPGLATPPPPNGDIQNQRDNNGVRKIDINK